ncbi:MAG: ABC transporter permease subunit, partial [Acutalibacteraceae bacterium]
MIPYQVILIPLYITYAKFKLLDTYFSLILPQVAFGMPMAVQLFLAFFKDFEEDMIEAAVIDGSSIGRAFISIVAPICRNIIITIATLRAIFSWNEYIFSYTFISSKKMMTVVLGLNAFVGEEGLVDWGPTFAAIAVTVIPTLIVYMFENTCSQASEGSVKANKQEYVVEREMQMNEIFFRPEGAWVGDCMPCYHNGIYYMYYQCDKREPKPFPNGEPFGWSLAVTENLIDFHDYGEVLHKGEHGSREHCLYAGSVIYALGKFRAFYTGECKYYLN